MCGSELVKGSEAQRPPLCPASLRPPQEHTTPFRMRSTP